MKRTKPITVAAIVVLLAVGAVATQAAIPGVTAQQTPDGDAVDGLVVDSISAPASAGQDSNISVEAQITNTGNDQTTETVEYRLDGNVLDQTTVTLSPGETTNVTLSANTDEAGPGEVFHGVFTPADGQLTTLNVVESFVIDEFDAPDTAEAGEEVTVTTNITNPGDTNSTQNVTFRLEGQTVATEEITITSGETEELTFTLDTTGVEAGVYVHSIFTRDFGQFDELEVTAAPDNATNETPADNGTATPADNGTATPADNGTATPGDDVAATPGDDVAATPGENITPIPTVTETATPDTNATATNETATPTET